MGNREEAVVSCCLNVSVFDGEKSHRRMIWVSCSLLSFFVASHTAEAGAAALEVVWLIAPLMAYDTCARIG